MLNPRHKEITKHFRKRLKVAGIKARCRAYVSCGFQFINIATPTFEAEFNDEQQATVLLIAKACHLTLVRGGEIDLEQRTYTKHALFEVPWTL